VTHTDTDPLLGSAPHVSDVITVCVCVCVCLCVCACVSTMISQTYISAHFANCCDFLAAAGPLSLTKTFGRWGECK
jgi:hypothetical protein